MNRYLQIVRKRAEELQSAAESRTGAGIEMRPTPRAIAIRGTVMLGGQPYEYAAWDGASLAGELIAFDTETSRIEGRQVPDLALVSVSDADTHRLVHPDDLGQFLHQHQGRHFVAHNAAFDYWVVDQHLRRRQLSRAHAIWQATVDESRFHDTMTLDALIRLGQSDEDPRRMRDLGVVSHHYAGILLDKSDPFRLRYAEIIGRDWTTVEHGFFEYAIKDAIATIIVFRRMTGIARRLMAENVEELLSRAVERFGVLTEALQVQGSIALAAIERNGLRIDLSQGQDMQARIHTKLQELTHTIESLPIASGVFKRDKLGTIRLTPKSHAPCMDTKQLTRVLQGLVQQEDDTIEVPRTTKTDSLTTSVKFWAQHCEAHPFIAAWVELTNLAKLSQFFANLTAEHIYPRYSPLVRTGRTSCSHPNIQQLPRAAGFREIIIPSPGCYLLTVDYAAVELRTLAAICEHRYGSSVLARVIRDGTDPHAYTAALFEGVNLGDLMALKDRDPQRFKRLRQQAKALNFGIPGGLGAASLVQYAASTYGVQLTQEAAQSFREKLINDIYPEIGMYLREDGLANLARSLHADPHVVRGSFQSATALRNVVRGSRCKLDGTPYNATWYEGVWDKLIELNENPDLVPLLATREGSEDLHNWLFWGPVTTLTGRVRGRVSFSQARNTPFQGLAADGAKRSLWKLTLAGYRCVAFVHDEVLIELPIDADHAAEARCIDGIMCDAMQEFTGAVPVACEYALSTRWCKQAEAVYDGAGRLVPWQTPQGE